MSDSHTLRDSLPHNGDSPEPCPACVAPAGTGGGESLVPTPAHATLTADLHQNVRMDDEPRCSPLCGASKAYGKYDQPWKHEPQCPVRLAWERQKAEAKARRGKP